MDHDRSEPTTSTPPDPAPTRVDDGWASADWHTRSWDAPSWDRDVLRGYLLDLLDRRSRELAARDQLTMP